jgi:hypothetical protein
VKKVGFVWFVLLLVWCFAMQESVARQNARKPLIGISAGLGVSANSSPSIVDYVNAVAQPPVEQRADEFSASTEFFIVPEYQISDEWSIALDYSYFLKSYSFESRSLMSRLEFTHTVHMPLIVVHYLIPGIGFWLKAGGGIGYHVGSFTESFAGYGLQTTSRAKGLGLKIEAIGNTAFDESFYGSIGVDLRWVFGSAFKTASGQTKSYLQFSPQMSFFSVGLKFGIMVLP